MKPRVWCIFVLSLLVSVASCSGYTAVSDEQLGFLTVQKKPLLLPDVTKRLGRTEVGSGPYYVYRIAGSKQTVEFWLAQPPKPESVPLEGVPMEVAMVVRRSILAACLTIPAGLWPGSSFA